MTRVIGISGKKQSGKNTSANYIHGLILSKKRPPNNESLIEDFRIVENGSLEIYTSNRDGKMGWGEFDIDRKDEVFVEYAEREMWPLVKSYSFADTLKGLCVSLFNIEPHKIYGTDDQKNELTHLLWEDMPGVISPKVAMDILSDMGGSSGGPEQLLNSYYDLKNVCIHEPGPMTGREFMQYFGTGIMRKMYGPIWIDAITHKIQQEQPEIAIITDVRFPNEVDAVLDIGGEVWRLLRQISDDQDISEIALDPENFDQEKFTNIIGNNDITVQELCEKLWSLV